MIQGRHPCPHVSLEGKAREGFLERSGQFSAWKGEREEARVPSWESSELHTSEAHNHMWVVPRELHRIFSKPRE